MKFTDWLKCLLSGKPHFYIGGSENPYMLRWFLIPRNRWVNIYLHCFMRDDDDRALHDHPWNFVSIVLRGMYTEILAHDYDGTVGSGAMVVRSFPDIAFRRADHRHRVVLQRDSSGAIVPCWTLVITGPKVRAWGFWCEQGFVPWQEFVAMDDRGAVGRGCGEP